MGIGSVNDYAGFLQNYKIPTIPSVSLDEIREQERMTREPVTSAVTDTHETPSALNRERKDALLEDISITFNRKDDFGYIGRDSDIRTLDVEQALDDMRKDQVLQQYQYFVGSSRSLFAEQSADGVVVQKF